MPNFTARFNTQLPRYRSVWNPEDALRCSIKLAHPEPTRGLYYGLATDPFGFARVVFFNANGQLLHWRESGAFESYADPWIEKVEAQNE